MTLAKMTFEILSSIDQFSAIKDQIRKSRTVPILYIKQSLHS